MFFQMLNLAADVNWGGRSLPIFNLNVGAPKRIGGVRVEAIQLLLLLREDDDVGHAREGEGVP